MAGVSYALVSALKIYEFFILAWVLGSWLPQARNQQWYRWISSVVEPYVELFRPLKLNYSGIDLSPMVAMLAIELFRWLIIMVAARGSY
ncbi:MAG: YggT family protein [bacterium]|nr:YggT family protein [bacterium]